MTFLNQTDLVGSLVPNARISRITLRTKGDALVESNPHVDDEREADVVTDPRTGKNVRQFQGNDFLKKSAEANPLFVDVDIVLKEKLDDSLIGEWFGNEQFSKYLKIMVVQISDPELTTTMSVRKRTFVNAIKRAGLFNASLPRKQNILSVFNSRRRPVPRRNQRLLSRFGAGVLDSIRDSIAPEVPTPEPVEEFEQVFITKLSKQKTKTLSVGKDIIGDKSNITDHSTEQDADGNLITTFNFRTSFQVNNSNPDHLSYFVFSYIDMQELIQDFDLDLDLPFLEEPVGRVVSDIVIEDGELLGDSFVYTDPEGKIWAGNVEFEENEIIGTDAEGSRVTLERTVVGNSKVQDFRNFRDLERLTLDFSVIENELLDEKLDTPRKDKLNFKVPKMYFSDAYLSRDEDGNARFAFSMDFRRMLEDNARYRRLIAKDNSFTEAIRNSAILSMKIMRRRVAGSPEIGSEPDITREFEDNQFDETIIVSGEKTFGGFGTRNNDVGAIREINRLSVPNQDLFGIRHFTGIDKTMPSITDGYYRYGVELEIEDSSHVFLERHMSRLMATKERLTEYYNEATSLGSEGVTEPFTNPHIDYPNENRRLPGDNKPANFNPNLNRFTDEFINQQRRKYARQAQRTPWTQAIQVYLSVLDLLREQDEELDILKVEKQLLHFTSPATGTPTGILKLIQLIDKLQSEIARALGVQDRGGVGNSLGRPVNSSAKKDRAKNSPAIRTFKVTTFFKDAFDSSVDPEVGYDFLDIQPRGDRLDGLKIISGDEYAVRVERELDSLFIKEEDKFPDINLRFKGQTYTQNDSVDRTSYGFLTPSRIKFKKNIITRLGRSPFPDIDLSALAELDDKIKKFSSSIQNKKQAALEQSTAPNPNVSLDIQNKTSALKTQLDWFANLNTLPVFRRVTDLTAETLSDIISDPAPFQRTPTRIDPIPPDETDCKVKTNEIPRSNPLPLLFHLSKTLDTQKSPRLSPSLRIPTFVNKGPQVQLSNRIKNFDLDEKNNFVSRMISNPRLISSEAFFQGEKHDTTLQDALIRLPNQIKSLLLSRTNPDVIRRNFLDQVNDPFRVRFLESDFRLSYRMINAVLVFKGYEEDVEGRLLIKKPRWEPLDIDAYNDATGQALLCRLRPYENKLVGSRDKSMELPSFDEYFLLKPRRDFQIQAPVVKSFSAKPSRAKGRNQEVELSWETENASSVTIETSVALRDTPSNFFNLQDPIGKARVKLANRTIFTLTAIGQGGQEVQSQITVSIESKRSTLPEPFIRTASITRKFFPQEKIDFLRSEGVDETQIVRDILVKWEADNAETVRVSVVSASDSSQVKFSKFALKDFGQMLITGTNLFPGANKIIIRATSPGGVSTRELLHVGIPDQPVAEPQTVRRFAGRRGFVTQQRRQFQLNPTQQPLKIASEEVQEQVQQAATSGQLSLSSGLSQNATLANEDAQQTSIKTEYMSNNIISENGGVTFGGF